MIRGGVKLLTVVFLVASFALNIAILTVSGVYTTASAAVSAVGVTTVAAREAGQRLARREATRKIGQETAEKVTRRMQRGAARNIASVGGEAIPVIGVAVIAGALAYEVKDACDTAADMAGLQAALGAGDTDDIEAVRRAAAEAFDCTAMIQEQLPNYDSLPDRAEIWEQVRASPQTAWTIASSGYDDLRGIDWAAALQDFSEPLGGYFNRFDPFRHWWDGAEETRP